MGVHHTQKHDAYKCIGFSGGADPPSRLSKNCFSLAGISNLCQISGKRVRCSGATLNDFARNLVRSGDDQMTEMSFWTVSLDQKNIEQDHIAAEIPAENYTG